MNAKTKERIQHILRTAQPLNDESMKEINSLMAAGKRKKAKQK